MTSYVRNPYLCFGRWMSWLLGLDIKPFAHYSSNVPTDNGFGFISTTSYMLVKWQVICENLNFNSSLQPYMFWLFAVIICFQIDETCVEIMSDDQLKQYLPKYGDRLALRGFASKMNTQNSSFHRKQSILDRLRCKLEQKPLEKQVTSTKTLQPKIQRK